MKKTKSVIFVSGPWWVDRHGNCIHSEYGAGGLRGYVIPWNAIWDTYRGLSFPDWVGHHSGNRNLRERLCLIDALEFAHNLLAHKKPAGKKDVDWAAARSFIQERFGRPFHCGR